MLNRHKIFTAISCMVLLHQLKTAAGYMVGNNPYRRFEILDSKGKYQAEWLVEPKAKRITFNVTVETKGYVGFGLSSNGKMRGADIVIGGVLPNGKSYFSDRHAIANQQPKLDPSQDWILNAAQENETHTFLSFSRVFDTCDPQDYPISEDKVSLLWSYGERDNTVTYHHSNRGVFEVYLLYPDYTPRITRDSSGRPIEFDSSDEIKVWTMSSKMTLPEAETTYWCRMYKAPELNKKHHIVGWDIRLDSQESVRHAHHLLVHKCNAPRGQDARSMFGPFVHHRGQQCLSIKAPTGPMPTEYCTEFTTTWAVGGRAFFLPPTIGLPFASTPDEYYLLQIHFDNPTHLQNVVVDLHVDYFYTDSLRPNDGGMMIYRHESPGLSPSLLVPPSSIDHRTYGICGSECTSKMFPKQGVTFSAMLLHTHTSGRRVKLHHFRNGRELPWIASDDNYSFNYQQPRALRKERQVLPGDQIISNCVYDNSWRNGTVVGGFSTQQEMCAIVIFYYGKILEYQQCSSEIDSPEFREYFLGVRNITWSNMEVEFVVDAPHKLAGMTISEVSDNYVNWTLEKREALDKFHLLHPHVNRCPQELFARSNSDNPRTRTLHNGRSENAGDSMSLVSYPTEIRPYRPTPTCSFASH